MGTKKDYRMSLLDMTKEEVLEIIKDTRFCLSCRKAISYKIEGNYSKRRFCWQCTNKTYPEQVKAFNKKFDL